MKFDREGKLSTSENLVERLGFGQTLYQPKNEIYVIEITLLFYHNI